MRQRSESLKDMHATPTCPAMRPSVPERSVVVAVERPSHHGAALRVFNQIEYAILPARGIQVTS